MALDDLSQFLQSAADHGELLRVANPIHPEFELMAVAEQIGREFQEDSPAILFEQVRGSTLPVVANLLGSTRRFRRSLNCEHWSEVIDRLGAAFSPVAEASDWNTPFTGRQKTDRARLVPRILRRGACQQIVKLGKDFDLADFPIPGCWSGESGPALTNAVLITQAEAGGPVLERVPIEAIDSNSVRIHWDTLAAGRRLWDTARAAGRPLPIAIALGGDPLLGYVASLPLPEQLNPWHFAAALRDQAVNLVRGRMVELLVPAESEIVFEGYLEPDAPTGTGVMAGAAGGLVERKDLPELPLTAATHRGNPLWPTLLNSYTFHEDFVCSALTEQLLLAVLRWSLPEIRDLHLPRCGGHRRILFVQVSRNDPEVVSRLSHLLAGTPGTTDASIVVILPEQVPLRDESAVWRVAADAVHAKSKAFLRAEPGLSAYDVVQQAASGGRLVIDATPFAGHGTGALRASATPEALDQVRGHLRILGWNGGSIADSPQPARAETPPIRDKS